MDTLVCSSSSDGAHHQYCDRIVLYSLAFQRTYICTVISRSLVPLATIVIVLYMKIRHKFETKVITHLAIPHLMGSQQPRLSYQYLGKLPQSPDTTLHTCKLTTLTTNLTLLVVNNVLIIVYQLTIIISLDSRKVSSRGLQYLQQLLHWSLTPNGLQSRHSNHSHNDPTHTHCPPPPPLYRQS